jgi:monoamine oxidase
MRDISFLWALFYIAAAGNETTTGQGLTLLLDTTGGAQQDRIVGGSQLIWIRIAAALGRSSVVLNAPVNHISQSATGVTVTSAKGVYKGKHVIVAMPPALTARIMYEPALPPLRDQLVQRFPQGSYAKFEAVYDRPFWRENGSNGQVFGDNGVCLSWDTSPPDGSAVTRPATGIN